MARNDPHPNVRDRLLAAVGRLPPIVPAATPALERQLEVEGVRCERWRFRGPRDDILAWFLLAADAPRPAPALLALHPHGRQHELGKSQVAGLVGDPSRAYGLAAAHAGFGVLVPDLPGFEDRRPPLAARKANYALQGEAYERLLAMHALLQGSTLQGWILADLAACIDVLLLEPRVDGSRLGAFGHSFGGQEVLFAMLFDDRIRAGVCSCGFSLVRLLVERSISHNLALYLPGMLPDLDFDAILPALAPRPLFVAAGRRDAIWPIDGVTAVEARAKAAWDAAGAPDRLRFHYSDGGHDLPDDVRAAAIAWLKHAL